MVHVELQNQTEEILAFWFDELTPKQHFVKDDAVDRLISERFKPLNVALIEQLDPAVLTTARERLAAILVLDQFSRNIHRGDAKAFAGDARALQISRDMIASGQDKAFPNQHRAFIYMPFMHAENMADQEMSVVLFRNLANTDNYGYALKHRTVIGKFGRFPHRNAALKRQNTAEEEIFISTPGTGF